MSEIKSIKVMMPNADSQTPQSSFFHVNDLAAFIADLERHGFGCSPKDPNHFEETHGYSHQLRVERREDGAIALHSDLERLYALDREESSQMAPEFFYDEGWKELGFPWHDGLEDIVAAHIKEGESAVILDPAVQEAWAIVSTKTRCINLLDAGFSLASQMLSES